MNDPVICIFTCVPHLLCFVIVIFVLSHTVERPLPPSLPPSLTALIQHNQTLTLFHLSAPPLQRARASGFVRWPGFSRPGISWPGSPSASSIPRSTFATAPSPRTHLSRECLTSMDERGRNTVHNVRSIIEKKKR